MLKPEQVAQMAFDYAFKGPLVVNNLRSIIVESKSVISLTEVRAKARRLAELAQEIESARLICGKHRSAEKEISDKQLA